MFSEEKPWAAAYLQTELLLTPCGTWQVTLGAVFGQYVIMESELGR